MSKISEKDVVHLLQERLERLQNKIKKTEAVLATLSGGDETKLTKKERKVIKAAKADLKKNQKKKEKGEPEIIIPEV